MNWRWVVYGAAATMGLALLLLGAMWSRGSLEQPSTPASAGGLPDLTIDHLAIELESGSGACYTSTALGLRVYIENNGASFTSSFSVVANGLHQWVNGGIASGGTRTVWFVAYVAGSNMATVDSPSLISESDETNNTLTQAPPFPTAPLPCTPTPMPTKQPDPGDTDGDGCTDERENGLDQMQGGRRNYLNFWDFFDTPDVNNVRDKVIASQDLNRVLSRFSTTRNLDPPLSKEDALAEALTAVPTPPNFAYHTALDRGPASGLEPWDLASADGSISATDVFAAIAQFGHTCA
jgi:hypothetical protein